MSKIMGKYKEVKKLGRGAYGVVVLAVNDLGQKFAIKKINLTYLRNDPLLLSYLEAETQSMVSLQSQYIVGLHESLEDDEFKYMVLDYCEDGDLLNLQAKQPNKVFSLTYATQILAQVIKGLEYIHSKQYLHRDIKSQNILVKQVDGKRQYKLADFGFCKPLEDANSTVLGTPDYMAPEIFLEKEYSYEVDMWAFGVLFFFMLNMEFPFKKSSPHVEFGVQGHNLLDSSKNFSYRDRVQKGKKKLTENCTPEMEDLFSKIFEHDQNKRINFIQIRQHPVFTKHFQIIEQRSRHLYKKKFKPHQPPQSIILKSRVDPFTEEGLFLSYRLEKYKFLSKSFSLMDEVSSHLGADLFFSLKFNILKYQIFLLNELKANLNPFSINKYFKMDGESFCKTEEFTFFKMEINLQLKQIKKDFTRTYEECLKHLGSIAKKDFHFHKHFSQNVTEEQFASHWKISYRYCTGKAYEELKRLVFHEKRLPPTPILLVTVYHFFNHFVGCGEQKIKSIFGEEKALEFGQMRKLLEKATDGWVKKVIKSTIKQFG